MTTAAVRRALGRGALLWGVTLAAEAVWARCRPLPTYQGFDASGVEGPADGHLLRFLVVGDSTTTGPGLERADDIWVRQLARRFPDHRVTVSSLAVGGARARDVVRDQLPQVEHQADVAFVSVGGNDAVYGTPIRSFEQHLSTIVTRLRQVAPLVVLSGVGDMGTIPRLLPPLDRIMRARGRRVDAAHARVAARHRVAKVDMWGLTTHQFRTDPTLFSPDLFHPSAAGHAVWAEAAYVTVAPLLVAGGPR